MKTIRLVNQYIYNLDERRPNADQLTNQHITSQLDYRCSMMIGPWFFSYQKMKLNFQI